MGPRPANHSARSFILWVPPLPRADGVGPGNLVLPLLPPSSPRRPLHFLPPLLGPCQLIRLSRCHSSPGLVASRLTPGLPTAIHTTRDIRVHQGFSAGDDPAPRGRWATFRDICGCHDRRCTWHRVAGPGLLLTPGHPHASAVRGGTGGRTSLTALLPCPPRCPPAPFTPSAPGPFRPIAQHRRLPPPAGARSSSAGGPGGHSPATQPDTGGHVLCDPTHGRSPEESGAETERRWRATGCGGERSGV